MKEWMGDRGGSGRERDESETGERRMGDGRLWKRERGSMREDTGSGRQAYWRRTAKRKKKTEYMRDKYLER